MKKILGVIILIIVASLCACGKEPVEHTINILISGLQQPNERNFFATFIRLFEAEKNISVRTIYMSPEGLKQQIRSEQESGNYTTDVVMVDTANTLTYIEEGWMEDIGDVETRFSDRTFTCIFDAWTKEDNKTYFIPISFDVYISIFNRLSLPYIPETVEVERNDVQEITQISHITWEEMSLWATNIHQGTGTPRFGFPTSTSSSQLLYPLGGMALAYGATTFPLLNDQSALNAWNNLASLAHIGALIDPTSTVSANQPTLYLDSGMLWMSFGHMGPIGVAYAKNPSQYVLGPTPVAEETGLAGSVAGAWTYGIIKDSPNKELGIKWLEFITEPEVNYLYCTGLGGVISPIQQVSSYLGTSSSDAIMRIGLQVFNQPYRIVVVDATHYDTWNDVKFLYHSLYQKIFDESVLSSIDLALLQSQLDALRS